MSKIPDRLAGLRQAADSAGRRATAGYFRDNRAGIIRTRPASLNDHRDEVRAVWRRSAGIALDLIQNSGRLRGAADQVIADTVGTGLVLNPEPRLDIFGYKPDEAAAWVKTVKVEWNRWSWNALECDVRGKMNLPQIVDVALRHEMAFGEVIGTFSFFRSDKRAQLGIRSGTKFCLMTPTQLVQETNEVEGLYQGIFHDENGRATHYRFERRRAGIRDTFDVPALDPLKLSNVVHLFDPLDPNDVRGISRMAPAFRQHIQHETLVDATIQTQILQTVFAAALTSSNPSKEAFEAIEALPDDNELRDTYLDYFSAAFDKAVDGKIHISGEPQISHLAPGEKLELLGVQTPSPEFLSVSAELSRDMARAIGITYGGLTMDHAKATYSSVRMENASIWPVVMRRRERIAAPIYQAVYENWLDEMIGMDRIPFKGGYNAYRQHRSHVTWANWQGPAKPSADDLKSAKASTERLVNGTSSLAIETAELGVDLDEVIEQRKRELKAFRKAGLPSPFVRNTGGGGSGEDDGAVAAKSSSSSSDDGDDEAMRATINRAFSSGRRRRIT